MPIVRHVALSLGLAVLLASCAPSYRYPGSLGRIPDLENFIRHNPADSRVPNARRLILKKASRGAPWDEINEHLAQFEDIEGARYDEENNRLVIWGPKISDGSSVRLPTVPDEVATALSRLPSNQRTEISGLLAQIERVEGTVLDKDNSRLVVWGPQRQSDLGGMPPLLLDDFANALTVLHDGENPGVSIGTVSGRVPTRADLDRALSTKSLPIEYIPPSTKGTHMGSVLYEVDRYLKGLAHGEDNVTHTVVQSSVPGYQPVARLLQKNGAADVDKPTPLGLWWFVPDPTGVAFDSGSYTIRFVNYRMRVEYRALTEDLAVAAFGDHMNEHFPEFAREVPAFRELVRLHKLVQVARWYEDSGFPSEQFRKSYRRLRLRTPERTPLLQTLVATKPGPYPGSYYQLFLIGGVDLSTRNCYVPSTSVPAARLNPGVAPVWEPGPAAPVWSGSAPPRFGTFAVGSAPVPTFAAPVFAARPAPMAYAWTVNISGCPYVVASIPMGAVR